MIEDFRIERIALQFESDKQMLREFLQHHHLEYEENIETAFGIYGTRDELLGCGCAAGSLLKCFAVEDELRGHNALGTLVSALMQERFASGIFNLFVITRAYNEPLFSACGLFPLAKTEELIMLENQPDGPEKFARKFLREGDGEKKVGAIVMNCNPFTWGHRRLIEHAAKDCDVLHIFVVEEDRSFFPTEERYRLVCEGTADLPNVRVHLSGPYMISSATFPTYFLKSDEDAGKLQSELDITLFAERIAPQLHITCRYAGEEPKDPVTAGYNDSMRRILPKHDIGFVEIPRFEESGEVISASRVRELLRQGEVGKIAPLVPPVTRSYLAKWGGQL